MQLIPDFYLNQYYRPALISDWAKSIKFSYCHWANMEAKPGIEI